MRSPSKAKTVGQLGTRGGATDVALSGDHAYVADGEAGVQVIDVSNPEKPVRVGGLDTSEVAVSGHYAYVAGAYGGFHVIDVSDPANPRRVGGNSTIDVQGIALTGDKVYVASGDGLTVLNAFTPPLEFKLSGRFDGAV